MNIHVVTPVFESNVEWLSRCIKSVENQTCGTITHTLVVDGDPAFVVPSDFTGKVIHLPQNYADYGDTPRSNGIQAAIVAGASAIVPLDDDNWFEPDHIDRAIQVHQATGAALVASERTMVDLNGDVMGICSVSGTREFSDTSSVVYFPPVFPHLTIWANLKPWMHAIGDRVVWTSLIAGGFEPGLTKSATLNYRCTHAIHYMQFGKAVPAEVKHSDAVERAVERWEREGNAKLAFVHSLKA